jgi:hypothetical protein
MRGLVSLLVNRLVWCAPLCVAAQVSSDVAGAAIDERVFIELVEGGSVSGTVMQAGAETLILRAEDGRLMELRLDEISAVFTEERAEQPVQRTEGPPPSVARDDGRESFDLLSLEDRLVTDEEYEYALGEYKKGKWLNFFGYVTTGLSLGALITDIMTRVSANNTECTRPSYYDDAFYDDYERDGRCAATLYNVSGAMFVLSPLLATGGITMIIKGGQRKAKFAPFVRAYRTQQRERRDRERREQAAERDGVSTVTFSPVIARQGGGMRVRLTL